MRRRYLTWYGVQGIFLDEGSNLCVDVPYYDALVAYIKTALPTAVTVLNWGTGKPSFLSLVSRLNTADDAEACNFKLPCKQQMLGIWA